MLKADKKKNYQKEYMRKKRANVGLTEGSNKEGLTDKGLTYPAYVYALADPVKKEKLGRIACELKKHGVSELVRYGLQGPTFKDLGELT